MLFISFHVASCPSHKGLNSSFLLSQSRFLFLLLHHNVSPLFVLLSKLQMCFCILARGSATRKTCFKCIVKAVSRKVLSFSVHVPYSCKLRFVERNYLQNTLIACFHSLLFRVYTFLLFFYFVALHLRTLR